VHDFDKLRDDWQKLVQVPGFTTHSLEVTMEKELGGVRLDAARAIFAKYHKVREGLGLHQGASLEGHEGAGDRSATRAEAERIEIALASGVFTAHGSLVASAAEHLRKAWKKRIKRDPSQAEAGEAVVKTYDKRFVDSWALRDEDEMDSRIRLRRDLTVADKVWLASKRAHYAKVVDAATEAWLAGTEGELERELRNARSGFSSHSTARARRRPPTSRTRTTSSGPSRRPRSRRRSSTPTSCATSTIAARRAARARSWRRAPGRTILRCASAWPCRRARPASSNRRR
jgi:hypothetical protein